MQRRFHKDIHLGNNAITNTCLWSHTGFGVGNEAILALVFVWRCSALVFATQPCQLSLPKSCTNIHLCREAASTLVFVRKLYQHLSSHWWCTNTYLCNEDVSTFVLGMKLYQQFFLHWWCTIINFCHETTSTLYLHRSHVNICLCHDTASTLHLYWICTNIGLCNEDALALFFTGVIVWFEELCLLIPKCRRS